MTVTNSDWLGLINQRLLQLLALAQMRPDGVWRVE